jgi:hypothetical protein
MRTILTDSDSPVNQPAVVVRRLQEFFRRRLEIFRRRSTSCSYARLMKRDGRSTRAGGFRPPRRWQLRSRLHLRRSADEELLAGAPQVASPLLAWRAAQLTSGHNRRVLARSLHATVVDLDAGLLPGASPLNRPAARPQAQLIDALADRLEDLSRPVLARGILLVDGLLTDGTGPLYARSRAGELRAVLERCLTALDVPGGRPSDRRSPTEHLGSAA